MTLLRITQTKETKKRYQVEIAIEGDKGQRRTARARFNFKLSREEQEDLRWYFEDYLVFSGIEPAPMIAGRIQRDMQAIGARLFKAVFQANNATRRLWDKIVEELSESRVEIAADVSEGIEVPWELLFDPDTNEYLALQAHTFVRTHSGSIRSPRISEGAESIRILLAICRPARDRLPFRSDAMCILKGLSIEDRRAFQLDILRPPTFERLARVLRDAKDRKSSYHIVHFDGHGTFDDVIQSNVSTNLLLSTPARDGAHGYLIFENPDVSNDIQLVDGPALGRLLVEARVQVLVLNACRSGYAEPREEPSRIGQDPHATVRAFGSLAQEVMDHGFPGVVAMRYSVYVMTGAQFLIDLYGELARAGTLGQSVSVGRKQLRAKPLREIAYKQCSLEDWSVPVVYEAAPLSLLPQPVKNAPLKIKLKGIGEASAGSEESELDPGLPKTPDAGFFGRDETLLALDRAFDSQSVVLLHAYAGSGKTATAAEFARWYTMTGGLDGGPVLFTSFFERKVTLREVLSHFGQMFGRALEQGGINWGAITEKNQMRDIALQVLRQVPTLWIWDNVEPVAGFPSGTKSAWSEEEQKELVDFLRDARGTKAKFLLTSRRDEREWLGDELPMRITIPPMPMQERVQLARALADKYGRRLEEVEDWRPLLEFTRGNPLTITVLVGQALRDGLKSKDDIEGFVERLRKGEAKFKDEESEGRSKSLGASLNYGFEQAFGENERRQLALLHLFQGFVDVDALKAMGSEEADWGLDDLRGLTREEGIELLDKAAEVGLLTAHGGGYYSIHPALPWFFKGLFDKYYPAPALAQTRAFVEAIGKLGNYYHRQYSEGNQEVIAALMAEEENLLYARQLARANGWWDAVAGAMQGLQVLYQHTGRRSESRRLVEEIVPDFVDPATDGPLPGREDEWSIVTGYRVLLAEEERQWAEAERLQQLLVDRSRKRAASSLEKKPETLNDKERNQVRTLAASLHELGEIQREQKSTECLAAYKEALELANRIGDRTGAATCAFNLGHAYEDNRPFLNLDKAGYWYQRSFELRDGQDQIGRASCLAQLGFLVAQRFDRARAANESEDTVMRYFNKSVGLYRQALEELPEDAVDQRAKVHRALGAHYAKVLDIDNVMPHFQEAIRYAELGDNLYEAAQARFNVAISLALANRFTDALEYARAALRNFESYGQRAAAEIEKTKKLIAKIEEDMKSPK